MVVGLSLTVDVSVVAVVLGGKPQDNPLKRDVLVTNSTKSFKKLTVLSHKTNLNQMFGGTDCSKKMMREVSLIRTSQ